MKISTTFLKNKYIKGLLALLFWLAIWELIYKIVNVEYIFPGPKAVLIRLFNLLQTKDFYLTILTTMGRIILGFLSGLITGTILSVITWYNKTANMLISPFMGAIKAVPVVSFIILTLIWSGSSGTVVICSFLMVTPLVWTNISKGLESVDERQLEMAKMYKFTKNQRLIYLSVPASFSQFITSVTTGIGLAWKSGVAAEVLGTPNPSIGRAIYYSKVLFEFTDLFAWTVAIIIISLIMEKTVKYFGEKLSKLL